MNFKISKYVVISDPISGGSEADLTSKRMIFSTRKGMGIAVSNYLLNILNTGQFESIPDHMFNILMYHEIIVPSSENELEEILNRKKACVQDVKATEIELNINVDTRLDEDLSVSITNQINERLSSSENRTHQVRLKLDILAPHAHELISLYEKANYFFKQMEYPCKVKIDAWLRCTLNQHDRVPNVEEDFIGIAQFHFLIDLRKRLLDQSDLVEVVNVFSDLEKNEAKTFLYLIINEAKRDLLYALRDVLLSFNTLKKVTPKVVVVNEDLEISLEPDKELELLKMLSRMNLNLDLLQLPDCKYYAGEEGNDVATFQPSSEFIGQWAREPRVASWGGNFKMEYYDTKIIDQLESQTTKCSSCVYLPVCGGRLDKNIQHDKDCPSFISNLVYKALVKYGIALQSTEHSSVVSTK